MWTAESKLYGEGHRELLGRLKDEWTPQGPPVAWVLGFPGVGKTEVALRVSAGVSQSAVLVEAPESGDPQDFVDELVFQLQLEGLEEEALKLSDADDRWVALTMLFQEPLIVILDEAQRFLDSGGLPEKHFQIFLERLAKQRRLPGRLLLLSNQRVDDGLAERQPQWWLRRLPDEDARGFLRDLLAEKGREEDLNPAQMEQAVERLNGNPRALMILAAALEKVPYEELVIAAELSESDRALGEYLVEKLEKRLLQRVLEHLEEEEIELLRRLSVYRRAVKRKGVDALIPAGRSRSALREALINNFLMSQRAGRYELHPLAREIALKRLEADEPWLREAHSSAADYLLRPFQAQQTKGADPHIVGSFTEARYHLRRAGRETDLGDLARRFSGWLRERFSSTSPVPRDSGELDERIALLAGALQEPGAKGLEYYLARLYRARGRSGDLEEALKHARRACSSQAPAQTWVFNIELEAEIEGLDAAIAVARRGFELVPADKNLFSLYQSCGELLSQSGRVDEAVSLLREGIGIVPKSSVFSLYQSCGEVLSQSGRVDEAVSLLREGIGIVPKSQNLFALYQSCGEVLSQSGRVDEAVSLLREGIGIVPKSSVFSLYQSCGAILSREDRRTEQIALLQEGLGRIPHGRFNRPRLAEGLVLACASSAEPQKLRSILAAEPSERPTGPQSALAQAWLAALESRWADAAQAAAEGREQFPRYLPSAFHEAFFRLCAGQPSEAQDALDRFPNEIQGKPRASDTWLQAFIAHRNHQPAQARKHLAVYLDRPLAEHEEITDDLLIRLWDKPAEQLMERHPSYDFPILPPSLTGRQETLHRESPYVPSILEPPQTPKETKKAPPILLSVATEWTSKHGGLSTLNRGLCLALAAHGWTVYCLVPQATPEENAAATDGGVELIVVEPLWRSIQLPGDCRPDIVLGHDRITGEEARSKVEDQYPEACFALMIHTAPEEIEWQKPPPEGEQASVRAEERRKFQRDLAEQAKLVFAVGPRLTRNIETEVSGTAQPPTVRQLLPGLDDVAPTENPAPDVRILMLGRAEDAELKGLYFAARAVAACGQNAVLIVRGAPPGTGDALRKELRNLAPKLQIRVREYTPDVEELDRDLRSSSLVLMPSRAEGFGLVGLEAISRGIPALISGKSGLGETIRESIDDPRLHCVVEVEGHEEEDVEKWSQAIQFVLKDRKAAFERARELRERLAEVLKWERAAADFAEAYKLANLDYS